MHSGMLAVNAKVRAAGLSPAHTAEAHGVQGTYDRLEAMLKSEPCLYQAACICGVLELGPFVGIQPRAPFAQRVWPMSSSPLTCCGCLQRGQLQLICFCSWQQAKMMDQSWLSSSGLGQTWMQRCWAPLLGMLHCACYDATK